MKRFFILSIALAAVVIGCTKGEIVKAPGHKKSIKFETYVGKTPATKAVSADLAYLKSFTAEETPAFHVNAFIHEEVTEVDVDNKLVLEDISMSKPYMDKDVWWSASEGQAGIPEETATVKVIFSTAAEQPELEGAYDGTTIPAGWLDEFTQQARWYATSILTTSTDDAGTTTSTWGTWNITKLSDENNINAGGAWDYPGTVYWPDATSGRKLAFSAYSLNAKEDITFTDGSFSDFTYNLPQTVAEQNDLLVTPLIPNQATTATGEHTSVGLSFRHLLTRVGFSLIANRSDDDIKVTIKSITLKGSFPSSGTVNLKTLSPVIVPVDGGEYDSFSLFGDATAEGVYNYCELVSSTTSQPIYANMTYTPAETETNIETGETTIEEPEKFEANASADPDNRFMMIIPDSIGAEGCIEVEYQLTDADPQKAVISLADWTFEAGKSYDFVFKVSTSAIGFYVEVTSWDSYFPNDTNNGIFTLTPEIVDSNN